MFVVVSCVRLLSLFLSSSAMGSLATNVLKIRVVDDNYDDVLALSTLLKQKGHEVEVAYDGATAITKAVTYRPDLILLDIGMPLMSGYSACYEIRRTEEGRRMMIIAHTAWGEKSDLRDAKDAGFDGHLLKPVEVKLIDRVLEDAARRKQLSNEV